MAPIAVGDTLPEGTLSCLNEEGATQQVSIHSIAKGKKLVLLGVPGAFTPTCSQKHVPGFIEKAAEFKRKGVDEIICISVNDPYVVNAWSKSYSNNSSVKFLADGSAKYTHALGLELDMHDKGMGVRSQRFSLLVDNLVVKAANIEGGEGFSVSNADDLLKALDA